MSTETAETQDLSRNAVTAQIKRDLRRRSGKSRSVSGGRGTAYGWIRIRAPRARCTWHYENTGEKDVHGCAVYRAVNDPSIPFGYMGPGGNA